MAQTFTDLGRIEDLNGIIEDKVSLTSLLKKL